MNHPTVTLKPGREKSLLRRHPWIFSGALDRVEGDPAGGDTVTIRDSKGAFLARGAYSPSSRIPVRVWSFDEGEEIDEAFFHRRVEGAASRRTSLFGDDILGYRVVHGESDGLPGVIVDRYGDHLVVQLAAAGAERWKDAIVSALADSVPARGIFERSEVAVRKKEGLPPRVGLLRGEEPPDLVPFREGEYGFLVDVRRGQKTGFYLDQRENREVVRSLAEGREVLNAFSYTGAFAVAALCGGAAKVTNVESSAAAHRLAAENLAHNDLDPSPVEEVEGDVFQVLRKYRDEDRRFDMVVLDPPKFADNKGAIPRAARGYKDVNWLAFRLLRPGGVLVTFSCSGLLEFDLFQKIVADAALDARREGRLVRRLGAGADHPVLLSFPESMYLKGFVVIVS
ncbi:MAG: class I SAM-dependent methyltransferase [Candidatus Eisenbacteria bacterium]